MQKFHTYSINIHGHIHYIDYPWIMGILNVTPDSFYSGSRCDSEDKIIKRIHQIVDEGAEIIDIGGYSSRPFAEDISDEEEFSRLSLGLRLIRQEVPNAIISVDTFRSGVARKCVDEYGVEIINDISGGTLDNKMFDTVASLKVAYILMHMRGTPHTMTTLTDYNNVIVDIIKDLAYKKSLLREAGVNDIIIDPGFGFSKTIDQNFALLANLKEFQVFDLPVLVGISRKSMIYKSLDITPEDSLNGTTVLNTLALTHGAQILRVHDVKAAKEAVKLVGLTTKNTNIF